MAVKERKTAKEKVYIGPYLLTLQKLWPKTRNFNERKDELRKLPCTGGNSLAVQDFRPKLSQLKGKISVPHGRCTLHTKHKTRVASYISVGNLLKGEVK